MILVTATSAKTSVARLRHQIAQGTHASWAPKAVRSPGLALYAGHCRVARREAVPGIRRRFQLAGGYALGKLRQSGPQEPTRRCCLVSRRSDLDTTEPILTARWASTVHNGTACRAPPIALFSGNLAPRAGGVFGKPHPFRTKK